MPSVIVVGASDEQKSQFIATLKEQLLTDLQDKIVTVHLPRSLMSIKPITGIHASNETSDDEVAQVAGICRSVGFDTIHGDSRHFPGEDSVHRVIGYGVSAELQDTIRQAIDDFAGGKPHAIEIRFIDASVTNLKGESCPYVMVIPADIANEVQSELDSARLGVRLHSIIDVEWYSIWRDSKRSMDFWAKGQELPVSPDWFFDSCFFPPHHVHLVGVHG